MEKQTFFQQELAGRCVARPLTCGALLRRPGIELRKESGAEGIVN
jgi:hypothetical protein